MPMITERGLEGFAVPQMLKLLNGQFSVSPD